MSNIHGMFLEDLKVGMDAVMARTVTDADIVLYAGVSGDTNPIHLNQEYAATTIFKTRIAHGMLSAGFISAVLGTKLPGPGAVYVSQTLRFKAPVRVGDTVTARVEVTEIAMDRKRASFKTECLVGGKVVIEGDAVLMIPSRV
ncbi:MAG TPA: MaoC family dehydratase [Magnetospirillaceae bacterium]|jgi:3-hydroxybutyryl-CoA dehydratase